MQKQFNWLRIIIVSAVCTAIVLSAVKLYQKRQANKAAEVLTNKQQTRHFNIHSNLDARSIENYIALLEGFYRYFRDSYFDISQKKPLDVYLFKDEESYKPYVNATKKGYTEFGFYTGLRENSIIINAESGKGTITHELTHYFIDLGFEKKPPKWIDEGIATFFEKFIGHYGKEGELYISFGYFSDWRFPITKSIINEASLAEQMKADQPDQSLIRSFTLFLNKKGCFSQCVKRWQKNKDSKKWTAILEEVYGAEFDEIEKQWKAWVNAQPIDADVMLVRQSNIMEDWQWDMWWQVNKHRLFYDEKEKIYRVRK